MSKPKKTKITYSEEALKFFQEQNNSVELMTEPVQGDYIDCILGDLNNTYNGLDMDTEFEELDSESDWFMD